MTTPSMRLLSAAKVAAGGAAFNPETDITWHSLFWAEGSAFTALGLSDSASVTTWPNETSESDLASGTGVTYQASTANLNSQPSVSGSGTASLVSADFTIDPVYTSGVSVVLVVDHATGSNQGLVSGKNASKRSNVATGTISITMALNAGTATANSTSVTSGGHLFVAQFDGSTANETLEYDGNVIINANAGSETIDGLRMFTFTNGAGNYVGKIAFAGVYEGDITADPSWADFKTWVTDHYGITIA